MQSSNQESDLFRSIPALAAAIRNTDNHGWPTATGQALWAEPLSSLYEIRTKSLEAEARAAVHLVGEVAERLRRLGEAYGEWESFDPSAYFDLSEAQAQLMVRVKERISTVYIAFFVDPLLPSFRKAETFWVQHFVPAYHAARPTIGYSIDRHSADELSSSRQSANGSIVDQFSEPNSDANQYLENGTGQTNTGQSSTGQANAGLNSNKNGSTEYNSREHNITEQHSAFETAFVDSVYPEMVSHWQDLIVVGQQARRALAEHIGYLAVNGSQEERARWRSAWQMPASAGLGDALCPKLQTLPTLSLSIEFPLPIGRQPGRHQRLKMNRRHQRPSKP